MPLTNPVIPCDEKLNQPNFAENGIHLNQRTIQGIFCQMYELFQVFITINKYIQNTSRSNPSHCRDNRSLLAESVHLNKRIKISKVISQTFVYNTILFEIIFIYRFIIGQRESSYDKYSEIRTPQPGNLYPIDSISNQLNHVTIESRRSGIQ